MYAYLRLSDQPMQIRFEFRKARAQKLAGQIEKDGTLAVVLTINNHRQKPFNSPITCSRAVWDARRSIRPSAEVKLLNAKIQDYQRLLELAHAAIVLEAERAGQHPLVTPATIRARLTPRAVITLGRIYADFRAAKKVMIENDRRKRTPDQISQSTYDSYPKRWVLIHAYLTQAGLLDASVEQISYASADRLKRYLLTLRQDSGKLYELATINKVISLLKMLLTFAVAEQHLAATPLASYSCRGGSPANPKPLSEAQLDRLETCKLGPVLRHQCDSWLVAGELCLHYSDYMQLPQMKLIVADNGQQLYQHERSKQSGSSLLQTINLTPRAMRLIGKYGGVKGLYYSSSAYFSKLLKRIAKLADLRDESGQLVDLQFGQGRDSGLTARARQGANSIQLSKMAGWSRPSYANRYLGDAAGIVGEWAATLPAPKPTDSDNGEQP